MIARITYISENDRKECQVREIECTVLVVIGSNSRKPSTGTISHKFKTAKTLAISVASIT